ncbi:unnamed protein product, partial [Rotaria sp. Silwood2]
EICETGTDVDNGGSLFVSGDAFVVTDIKLIFFVVDAL